MKHKFKLTIYEDLNGNGDYYPFTDGYLKYDGMEADTIEEMEEFVRRDLEEWGYTVPKKVRFKKVMNPVPMLVYYSKSKMLKYVVNITAVNINLI
jgi:hypothetical protein